MGIGYVMQCQQHGSRTDCKNKRLHDGGGEGAKASCNVSRMRKANFI